MTKKSWAFALEDGKHTVELEHGYFSGKRRIHVDGRLLEETAKVQHVLFDIGSRHDFNINTHPCTVVVRTNGITFNFDLIVDGRSVTTGQRADPPQPLPSWAWIFMIACGIIPLVALGGAIPAALGVGGALGCAAVARDAARPIGVRAALCVGITVLAWILFVMLLVGVGILKA